MPENNQLVLVLLRIVKLVGVINVYNHCSLYVRDLEQTLSPQTGDALSFVVCGGLLRRT